MIFKFTNTIDRDEDPIFIRAETEQDARNEFTTEIGEIPASMLKVESVAALPDGHTCLNED